jgi:hypothetical protein
MPGEMMMEQRDQIKAFCATVPQYEQVSAVRNRHCGTVLKVAIFISPTLRVLFSRFLMLKRRVP